MNYLLNHIYASITIVAIVAIVPFYAFNGLSKENNESKYLHTYLRGNFVAYGTKWWEGIDTLFQHSNDGFIIDTLNVTFRRDTLIYDNYDRLCATVTQTGRYYICFDSMAYSFNEKNQVSNITAYWSEGTLLKKNQMNSPQYFYKRNYEKSYEYYEDGRVKSITSFNYDKPNHRWCTEFVYYENGTLPLITQYELPKSGSFDRDTFPSFVYSSFVQPNPWLRNIKKDEHSSFVFFEISFDTLNEYKDIYGYRSERHYRKLHY